MCTFKFITEDMVNYVERDDKAQNIVNEPTNPTTKWRLVALNCKRKPNRKKTNEHIDYHVSVVSRRKKLHS